MSTYIQTRWLLPFDLYLFTAICCHLKPNSLNNSKFSVVSVFICLPLVRPYLLTSPQWVYGEYIYISLFPWFDKWKAFGGLSVCLLLHQHLVCINFMTDKFSWLDGYSNSEGVTKVNPSLNDLELKTRTNIKMAISIMGLSWIFIYVAGS